MINKHCSVLIYVECVQYCWVPMLTTVEVQWDIYVQCGRDICSRAYASNVECMYTSVPGHIVHSKFI